MLVKRATSFFEKGMFMIFTALTESGTGTWDAGRRTRRLGDVGLGGKQTTLTIFALNL